MFKNLPSEIVNLILDYDNKIRYRNGKYIDRINIEDEKYDNLKDVIYTKCDAFDTIKRYYGLKGEYYLEIYIFKDLIKFGMIIDYYYTSRNFRFSTYKDISKTEEYFKKYALCKLSDDFKPECYFIKHYYYK